MTPAKLIITADIHGDYDAWLTIRALAGKNDGIVVAGDLFDTRYGNYGHPSFAPESIREDLSRMTSPLFYVYGNCDVPSFAPGYNDCLAFDFTGIRILLSHGHQQIKPDPDTRIVIQGHTHEAVLEKKGGQIFLNPGSIVRPRDNRFTYGIISKKSVQLIDLKTGRNIIQINR